MPHKSCSAYTKKEVAAHGRDATSRECLKCGGRLLLAQVAYVADDAEAVHGYRDCLLKEVRNELTAAVGKHGLVQHHGVGAHRGLVDGIRHGAQGSHAGGGVIGHVGSKSLVGDGLDVEAEVLQLGGNLRGGGDFRGGAGNCGGQHLASNLAQLVAFAHAHAQLGQKRAVAEDIGLRD